LPISISVSTIFHDTLFPLWLIPRLHLFDPINIWYHYDSKMGWDGLAAGGLENQEIPGHHTSMFEEPHVRVLAEKLRECIDKSQAVESGKQTESRTACS